MNAYRSSCDIQMSMILLGFVVMHAAGKELDSASAVRLPTAVAAADLAAVQAAVARAAGNDQACGDRLLLVLRLQPEQAASIAGCRDRQLSSMRHHCF